MSYHTCVLQLCICARIWCILYMNSSHLYSNIHSSGESTECIYKQTDRWTFQLIDECRMLLAVFSLYMKIIAYYNFFSDMLISLFINCFIPSLIHSLMNTWCRYSQGTLAFMNYLHLLNYD